MSIEFIANIVLRSLTTTLFIYVPVAVLRAIYLSKQRETRRTVNMQREITLWIFTFYIILLYQITVFRYGTNIEALLGSRPKVNLTPFTEVIKIYKNGAVWSFIYNLAGNILWFVPFGLMLPTLIKRHCFLKTALYGLIVSSSIEIMQFVLNTGISDIDDIIFNVTGAMAGYCLYRTAIELKKRHKT